MRAYDNNSPNLPPRRTRPTTWEPSPPPPEPEINEKLRQIVLQAVTPHDVATLVADTPDVVRWLRDRMKSGPEKGENGQQSAPPMKLSYMQAADREVEVLCYWAQSFGLLHRSDGLWVRDNVVRGVCGDDIRLVDEIALKLASKLTHIRYAAVAEDSRYGVWTVRKQHYANWPELAAFMATDGETSMCEPDVLF